MSNINPCICRISIVMIYSVELILRAIVEQIDRNSITPALAPKGTRARIMDAPKTTTGIDELNAWFLETPPGEQLVLPWEAVTGGDFKDSTKNMIMVASGSLLLKDSAEYIKLTDYGKIKRTLKKNAPSMAKAIKAGEEFTIDDIRKLQKKYQDNKSVRFEEIPAPEAGDAEIGKLVKTKKVELRPMSAEDAVLEMEMSGHDFFLFLDEETDSVNVVYKRKDDNYGVLETSE